MVGYLQGLRGCPWLKELRKKQDDGALSDEDRARMRHLEGMIERLERGESMPEAPVPGSEPPPAGGK